MNFCLDGRTNFEEIKRKRAILPSLFDFANENRLLNYFNDVEIRTGNDVFPGNRLVLSCCSPFFEKMFKVEMKERYSSSVEVSCINGVSMGTLLDYIYTGKIAINRMNVCDLLAGANYLQLEDVKTFCFEFLKSAVSPDNCCMMLAIESCYGNKPLKDRIFQVSSEKFDEVAGTEDFKDLPKNLFNSLMSSINRYKVPGISIYHALIAWIKHDEQLRRKDFPELLEKVKLCDLPSKFLSEVVSCESFIVDNIACSRILSQSLLTHVAEVQKIKEGRSTILSIGGSQTQFEVFDVFSSSFKYPNLPEGQKCGCALKLNKFIYYIGGLANEQAGSFSSVWKIAPENGSFEWKKIASLNQSRSLMDGEVFQEALVVAGGNIFLNQVSSGEFYIPSIDEWRNISVMNYPRRGNALAASDDCLYAIGGVNQDGECLSSVESLHTLKGDWKKCKARMQTPRSFASAVNCNGIIYVIGGKVDGRRLKCAEKLDESSEKWSNIADMNFCRSNFAACVLRGQIFVVGGLDQEGKVVREIESYNPPTNEWKVVGKTNDDLYNHSLVSV